MPKPIDLTGMKFGRLTVVQRAANSKDGRARWKCICDCGNERIICGKSLRSGHTQSCGCLNKEIVAKLSLIDHTGERFGMLTVVSRADDYIAPSGAKHVRWKCRCDCGEWTVVDICQLTSNKTRSCGCLKREHPANLRHGGRSDRLYGVFANMKNRCYNSSSDDYKYYGGRGIEVCDEWRNDYAAFRKWALANGYDPSAKRGKCTIDRIDVNGNYEPCNCRWVDMAVQSKNRRNVMKR